MLAVPTQALPREERRIGLRTAEFQLMVEMGALVNLDPMPLM